MHGYAAGDRVSPADKNDEIVAALTGASRYRAVRLEGDHSITNNIAIGAALARTAHQLLQTVV